MPVVTDSYVGCCICTGVPNSGYTKPYLPIPRTLYCTWGSWAGNLIWHNPSLPSWFTGGGCAYVPDSWFGVATIPFKYRTDDAYGYCYPLIYDTTAECVVAFNCFGYASWSVRAVQKNQCCLELDETQDQCAGGTIACYGIPFGHCFTCGESFAAALDGPTRNWIDAPCFGSPVTVWGHNVCDLQTSNCYITE